MLFKKNIICMNESLYKRQNSDGEIPVHMGEFVTSIEEER